MNKRFFNVVVLFICVLLIFSGCSLHKMYVPNSDESFEKDLNVSYDSDGNIVFAAGVSVRQQRGITYQDVLMLLGCTHIDEPTSEHTYDGESLYVFSENNGVVFDVSVYHNGFQICVSYSNCYKSLFVYCDAEEHYGPGIGVSKIEILMRK